MSQLTRQNIRRLFNLLNDELNSQSLEGELYLVGGAVMCLVFNARPTTNDIDGFFQPSKKIRQAAAKVAARTGIDEHWLNDAVKGYLSDKGQFETFLELSNLRVFTCLPEYLLAMKCLALRIGEEFHDLSDVQYLIRYLNLTIYQEVIDVITRYYPLKRFPQKTLYALEELLTGFVAQ